MDTTISFEVNGEPKTVTTHPSRPLLDVLREDLGLTGTKYGCGEGQCRACTVLLEGKAVAACVTQIATVENKKVRTIEGLADGDTLHPVQQAFLDGAASQCGYCTPGMVMELVAVLNASPKPAEAEVLARLGRHLCRCCNYPNLKRSIRLSLRR